MTRPTLYRLLGYPLFLSGAALEISCVRIANPTAAFVVGLTFAAAGSGLIVAARRVRAADHAQS